jgi:hypothetical protein
MLTFTGNALLLAERGDDARRHLDEQHAAGVRLSDRAEGHGGHAARLSQAQRTVIVQ